MTGLHKRNQTDLGTHLEMGPWELVSHFKDLGIHLKINPFTHLENWLSWWAEIVNECNLEVSIFEHDKQSHFLLKPNFKLFTNCGLNVTSLTDCVTLERLFVTNILFFVLFLLKELNFDFSKLHSSTIFPCFFSLHLKVQNAEIEESDKSVLLETGFFWTFFWTTLVFWTV